jgi:polysaccharide biosynthesis/export protein
MHERFPNTFTGNIFQMQPLKILLLLLLSSLLSSCYYNKRLVYFQDKRFNETNPIKLKNRSTPYTLQVNDVVSVKVKSATDREISSIFNITSETIGTSSTPGVLYMDGYSIDNSGNITLPVLGDIFLKGLTLDIARDSVQRRANKYLNQATVLMKLVSFKITVLGEVKNPGYLYVYNNQITVLEALGLAGDLTNFGNRTNIKLIRPNGEGSDVLLLDITDSEFLQSPNFYLMPNDVLYVEPLKARSKRSNLEIWSVVLSAATTAILVLSYINSQN